tara:strand:- start:269 stop:475 length:207 start_codon:yes stop_codon:yes gene_type:complete
MDKLQTRKKNMNNARRVLVMKVAEQIAEDVQDDVFAPLEVLLEDVSSKKLEAFIVNNPDLPKLVLENI